MKTTLVDEGIDAEGAKVPGLVEVSGDAVKVKVALQRFNSEMQRKTVEPREVAGSAKNLTELAKAIDAGTRQYVVLGAGIIGVSIALHLQERGRKVEEPQLQEERKELLRSLNADPERAERPTGLEVTRVDLVAAGRGPQPLRAAHVATCAGMPRVSSCAPLDGGGSSRPSTSAGPPGAKGTIIVMDRVG